MEKVEVRYLLVHSFSKVLPGDEKTGNKTWTTTGSSTQAQTIQ